MVRKADARALPVRKRKIAWLEHEGAKSDKVRQAEARSWWALGAMGTTLGLTLSAMGSHQRV